MISTTELLANGITATAIFLAGRNSIHTWWTGIIGGLIFTLVFYESHLYADVVLQYFFVVTSMVGWWQWCRGNQGTELPITRGKLSLLAWAVLFGSVVTLGYGALLHNFTDAYAPFLDSAILAFSVIAQIFLMQRRVETWLFWLLVNTIAVPLYASRGLYLTSVLYGFYWINALVSWLWWRRLGQKLQQEVVAA